MRYFEYSWEFYRTRACETALSDANAMFIKQQIVDQLTISGFLRVYTLFTETHVCAVQHAMNPIHCWLHYRDKAMKYTLILLFGILSSFISVAGGPPLNPEYTEIGGSFSTPLGVRNAGDGSNRLFVIERSGTIRVIDANGNTETTPFLDIAGPVDTFFEGGLLGLAFHPDYANNGYFYLNYTSDGAGSNSLTTNIVR